MQTKEEIQAKIAELKTFEGKYFQLKNAGNSTLVKVIKYDGVKVKAGIQSHTFVVESFGARWTPAATQFLEDYEVVESPEEKTINNEIV